MSVINMIDEHSNIRSFELFKRLTTIGSSKDADIKILSLPPIAAYISQSQDNFVLVCEDKNLNIIYNSRAVKKLSLLNNETFFIADKKFTFIKNNTSNTIQKDLDTTLVMAHQKLLQFSLKIAHEKNIDNLLNTLLTEITSLTNAEHGFLVLLENNKPVIKVQKNTSAMNLISDSIIKKVIDKKEGVIISNALDDQEFNSSMSVINYRLTSVMCVPLIYQGEAFGAIYVGNNSFINAFNQQSLNIMTIYSSQASLLLQNALHIESLKESNNSLEEKLNLVRFGGMIGSCENMQSVFLQVEKVATSDLSVMIVGEEGCGKELLAREIHARSLRKNGPFIALNCASIPKELLEGELFGYVRGAFSGALQTRNGKFQQALNGTLFLEEINHIPNHIQIKILEVLQKQQVTRLGDNKSDSINIRLICSVTKNLSIRQDLYYLLSMVEIKVPSLKDRGNDVLVMANFFLQKYASLYGKERVCFDEDSRNILLNYDWPGNVRELENKIRKALVMCDGKIITPKDLEICLDKNLISISLTDAIERFKVKYINDSLERNAGNRTKTAQELGVDPRTIFRHLESLKKSGEA